MDDALGDCFWCILRKHIIGASRETVPIVVNIVFKVGKLEKKAFRHIHLSLYVNVALLPVLPVIFISPVSRDPEMKIMLPKCINNAYQSFGQHWVYQRCNRGKTHAHSPHSPFIVTNWGGDAF